jgi:adenylate cyclase
MNNAGDRKHSLVIILLVVGSFIGVYVVVSIFSGVFDIFSVRINDQLFKLRYKMKGPEPVWNGGKADGRSYIVIVELDDRGYRQLEELKAFYGNRSFDADVINILRDADVFGIAYDTVFAKEVTDGLIDATARAGNVYYPVILAPVDNREQVEINEGKVLRKNLWHLKVTRTGHPISAYVYYRTDPKLAIVAKGIGHININPDIDGIYRRVPLLIRHGDGYVPALILRMAVDYLGVNPSHVEVAFGKHILLRDAHFPGGRIRDIEIPIDDKGQMIINFAGKWRDVFRYISFTGILNGLEDKEIVDILRDEIGGSLVVVADVSSRTKDFGAVPLENFYPLSNTYANVLNSIITTNFIYQLEPWQKLVVNLILILVLCAAAVKFRAHVFSAFTIFIFGVFIVFVLLLFMYKSTLTNVLSPSLGIVSTLIVINLYMYVREEREKAFLFNTFESYFAPSVLKKILKNPEKLRSIERKTVSILFSDISGFTSWSSTKEPEEIHSTLNEFYDMMAQIIFKYEGTIDKYMGDGMMAFFGDPIEYDDHALRAVSAAVEMQKKASEIREVWRAQGKLQLQMRIGINTGQVVAGNMGSEKRVDYTVIGSSVNLAHRLEENAPLEGILISQATYEELTKDNYRDRLKDINATFYGNIRIKGLSGEIKVYEVRARP